MSSLGYRSLVVSTLVSTFFLGVGIFFWVRSHSADEVGQTPGLSDVSDVLPSGATDKPTRATEPDAPQEAPHEMDLSEVANLIARYKAEHGRLPKTLEELQQTVYPPNMRIGPSYQYFPYVSDKAEMYFTVCVPQGQGYQCISSDRGLGTIYTVTGESLGIPDATRVAIRWDSGSLPPLSVAYLRAWQKDLTSDPNVDIIQTTGGDEDGNEVVLARISLGAETLSSQTFEQYVDYLSQHIYNATVSQKRSISIHGTRAYEILGTMRIPEGNYNFDQITIDRGSYVQNLVILVDRGLATPLKSIMDAIRDSVTITPTAP